MAKITEDYVSFETAKLLKEKGFDDIDCECYGWIGRSGKHYSVDDTFYDDEELKEAQEDRKDFVPLITLQMAMKWLREVHNVFIYIEPFITTSGLQGYKPYCTKIGGEFMWINPLRKYSNTSLDTYEETVEASIKYCLENFI